MICSKCSKENPEGMEFCGYCGNNLRGKVQCIGCGTWVEKDSHNCPSCFKKINSKKTWDQKKAKNKGIALIHNLMAIVFSLLMILCLFIKLADSRPSTPRNDNSVNMSIGIDFADYVEATITSFSDYNVNDFIEELEALGFSQATRPEDIPEIMNEMNFLKAFVIAEFDESFIFSRIILFINLVIIIMMLVLPLIALASVVYNLFRGRKRPLPKKLFVFSFMFGLILVITTLLMGFNASFGIFGYLILCGAMLVVFYCLDGASGDIKIAGKVFVTRLLTMSMLFLLFVLSTSSVVTFSFKVPAGDIHETFSNDLIFSDFSWSLDKFDTLGTNLIRTSGNVLNIIVNRNDYQFKTWINTADFVYAMLMLVATFLLIACITAEVFRSLNPEPKKKSPTLLLLWLAFIFGAVSLVLLLVIISAYNSYLLKAPVYDYSVFIISKSFIVFVGVTLVTAIYQTITNKVQNRIA